MLACRVLVGSTGSVPSSSVSIDTPHHDLVLSTSNVSIAMSMKRNT